MGLFSKKKNKQKRIEDAFDKVYSQISSIENWDDPKKLEHYILDSCEQIIKVTKEIEADKKEYRIISNYLKDIETIENLPESKMKEIQVAAQNVVDLNASLEAYANYSAKLTDEQFALIEADEDEIPGIIGRMYENEEYQRMVKKDMNYLEAEKTRWEIERAEFADERKALKKISILSLIAFVTILILLLVIGASSTVDLHFYYLLVLFLAAFSGFLIFVRQKKIDKENAKALLFMNQAISLLNVIKMKYSNVTQAIEYTKDRFKVQNSKEFNFVWEQYQEACRQRDKAVQNNDDLDYFVGRLMRALKDINLFDRKIWISQAKALADKKEMVEVKHSLILRRQGIRNHIDTNTAVVLSERNEIDNLMVEHQHFVPEIVSIIKTVDKLCEANYKK